MVRFRTMGVVLALLSVAAVLGGRGVLAESRPAARGAGETASMEHAVRGHRHDGYAHPSHPHLGTAGFGASPPAQATGTQEVLNASATFRNPAGEDVGTVRFTQVGGKVLVEAQVRNLLVGFHGFHVHAVGRCDAPSFESAGPHLAAPGVAHDDHAGDFPSVYVNADGTGMLSFLTDRLAVSRLLDADGNAVIVHANADNFANIPERYAPRPDMMTLESGDSGGRVACGVIG